MERVPESATLGKAPRGHGPKGSDPGAWRQTLPGTQALGAAVLVLHSTASGEVHQSGQTGFPFRLVGTQDTSLRPPRSLEIFTAAGYRG